MPIGRRALIRLATAGVVVSGLATAATFTRDARELTFLRYPLLGAAMAAVVLAAWGSARLPAFNRTLWAHAPWWARLAWLAIIAAAFGAFATISLSDTVPALPATQSVLEARGIGAVAAYLFLIAGLRSNVDESVAKGGRSSESAVD